MVRYSAISVLILALLCVPLFYLHTGIIGQSQSPIYMSVLTIAALFAFPNLCFVFAFAAMKLGLSQLGQTFLKPAIPILKFADRLSFHNTVVGSALVTCVNLLILAMVRSGEVDEAARFGCAELAYLEEAQGKNWPPLAALISDIGALHLETGKIVKSKELLHRALLLAEATCAQDASESAQAALITALKNLASVHVKLGDFPLAIAEYKRCVELKENRSGNNHWSIAMLLCNLADAEMQNGDYKSALPVLQRAFMISQDAHAPRELPVFVEDNLGEAFRGLGNLDEARRHLIRASNLANERLGKKHPLCGNVLEDLGKLYRDMGDYEAAEAYFKQNLDLARQRGKSESVELSRCLKSYAECLRKMNRNKEADDLEHRAEQIRYKMRSA